ncbi:hypothetical protein EBU02_10390 [bacterium]|nr:hypothetical protein [bacterium]
MEKSPNRVLARKPLHTQQRMERLVVPQPTRMRKPTRSHHHRAHKGQECSGAIALGERYSKGITSATRFANPKAPSHAKNEAIPANDVTAFGVLCNLISPEPKRGVN